MKIIICGSRQFEDYQYLKEKCTDIISKEQYNNEIPSKDLEIVSGNNPRGADWYGEKFSRDVLKKDAKLFPADWTDMTPPVMVGQNYYGAYNKLAGMNRNTKMVDYASKYENSICIAFDMGTKGTKDTVAKCKKAGVKTYQFRLDKNNEWYLKVWNQ